jgi:hypothetical protein
MSEDKLNANTDWVEVLNLIEQGKFSEEYPEYQLYQQTSGFFIQKGDKKIFLFDKEREIEFYFPAEKPRKLKIYSSEQIERYIEQSEKDIKKLYIKDKDNIRYEDYIEKLGYYLKSFKLEIRQKTPLPEFKLKKAFDIEENYTPNEYSKYFYEYFLYEDKEKGNKKLLFQNNQMREIIFDNINGMSLNKKIKTFKFLYKIIIKKNNIILIN